MEPNNAVSPAPLGQPASKMTFDGYFTTDLMVGMQEIIRTLRLDLKDPEYARTPERAASWFLSFARKPDYENEAEADKFLSVSFPSRGQGIVWESGLNFVSLCPHHLLPYSGVATIAYIPNGNVVGISKLSRALTYWTHYPVKQEDSTADLADALMKYITPKPKGVMVILKAHHSCMAFRGVEQNDHQTGTSEVRGVFEEVAARAELLRLAHV